MHISLLVLSLACVPVCGFTQVVDLANDRMPITELHGQARFHTGDDPQWSNPSFDDSHWPLIHIDQPWDAQGFNSESGLAWYRFQLAGPADHGQLAIYLPSKSVSFEIFINGQRVGRFGGLPPHGRFLYTGYPFLAPVFRIPGELLPAGRPVEVALRVWHWPFYTFVTPGLVPPPLIGDAQLLDQERQLRVDSNHREVSGYTFLFVACVLGFCAGLGLFLLRPNEREFLWFAAYELGTAGAAAFYNFRATLPLEWHASQILLLFSDIPLLLALPTFIVTFLREPRRRVYWATILFGLLTTLIFIPSLFHWIPQDAFIALVYPLATFWFAGNVLLTWIPARRGNLDARLVLGPLLVDMVARLAEGALWFLEAKGHYSLADVWASRYFHLTRWPFTFSAGSVAEFLLQVSLLAMVVLRFAWTSREEEHHKNELEAARVVQQMLVPAKTPETPNFRVESVYLPFGEVGGDFFQVVPTLNGGVLVVIGDVSGKGMPAAMTVSLLVGTFRTQADYTQSPGEILHAMNIRMVGYSAAGFTTCLVLRIDPDGTLTAANAGHLSPYLDGRELALENGLPLGLAAESTYLETELRMALGARITVMTDGVVEAQSPTRELFGFERAAALSTKPAEEVARQARIFGQEDDITVLTLTLAPL